MGEVLAFRTKKLTGFIPEQNEPSPKPESDDQDTAPAEYCAPEKDPA